MTDYVNCRDLLTDQINHQRHRWIGTASRLLMIDGFEATQAFEIACKHADNHGPNGDGPFVEAVAIRHLLDDEDLPFG